MTTEVLGFLIILGMLVVVVLNRQMWQQREPAPPSDDMEEAARRLRREMEQSADEIISRMGAHIDHLEHLVAEADKRARRLERQLEEMKEAEAMHETPPPPRYRNGFEKMLASSMSPLEERGPSRRARTGAATMYRRPSTTWEEPEAVPADMVEHQTPPVALAPSLEVVVAPSVADVVDLPLDPEEGEMTWTAADDRTEAETTVEETTYAAYPASMEREDASDYGMASEYEATEVAEPTYMAEEPAFADPAAEYVADAGYSADYAASAEAYPMSTESQAVPSMEEADVLAVSEETEETMLSELTGDVSPEEDENVWGEERLTAVNALPDGSVTAEDGEAPLTEESVWTEEDEEGAIESQQIAEVLQGSRSSASSRAREMLEQGRSADEVARELHMGRNAIELIAQMVRRKQAATH